MNELKYGIGLTIITILIFYVIIDKLLPYAVKKISEINPLLFFTLLDSDMAPDVGTKEDKNNEEVFTNALKYINLSEESEVVRYE